MDIRILILLLFLMSSGLLQAGGKKWWNALQVGDVVTLETELTNGRNPNRARNNGALPLTVVSSAGHIDAVRLLLNHGATPFPKTEELTPIRAAIEAAQWPVIKLLLDHADDINARDTYGRTALTHAVLADRPQLLKRLLDAGLDPNIGDHDGKTPLLVAAHWGRSQHAVMLLHHGADKHHKNDVGYGLVDFVALTRNTKLFEFLKQPDGWQQVPEIELFRAVADGDVARTRALIDDGLSLKKLQDFTKDSLVHVAVKHRRLEVLRVLLEYPTYIGSLNEDGLTPLMIAVVTEQDEAIRLLLDKGADVNQLSA